MVTTILTEEHHRNSFSGVVKCFLHFGDAENFLKDSLVKSEGVLLTITTYLRKQTVQEMEKYVRESEYSKSGKYMASFGKILRGFKIKNKTKTVKDEID